MTAFVAFTVGVFAALLVSGMRRRDEQAVLPATAREPVLSAAIQESITAFGLELDELSFDPAGGQVTSESIKEYRLALDAYDQARDAESETAALTALQDGRAALIRLDARLNGRPVPIDALPARPYQDTGDFHGAPHPPQVREPAHATGERFLSAGQGPGTVEVLVDRPEPGHPAIAEVIVAGDGHFGVDPVIRTGDRLERLDYLINTVEDAYRGRHYLEPAVTHLRVKASGEQRWSVRIQPLQEALPLETERHGEGNEVLAYQGGPALLTVQVRSEGPWRVRFQCSCGYGEECRCKRPAELNGMPGDGLNWDHGLGDGKVTLQIPRAGWIVMDLEDPGIWSLHVAPASPVR